MSDKIESLITQIVQGKSADAEAAFTQIISQKASDAIESMRCEVTDRMFNQGQFSESVFGAAAAAKYAGKSKETGDTAGDKMPKAKKPYVGNKIDLHLKNEKGGYDYWRSTTRSPTVKHAVAKAEESYPQHAGKLKGSFAESTEVESSDEEFFLAEGGIGGLVKFGDDAKVAKSTAALKASLAKGGMKFGKSTSTVITKDKDGNVVTKKETKDM